MKRKIDECLMEESKRIVDILVNIYENGNKIDKTVIDYIHTIIDSKYKKYEIKIMVMITKLVPRGLKFSPNFGEVFITDDDFYSADL